MAQRKGLVYRLTMGRDDNPDFTADKLPTDRLRVFTDIISQRLWALIKINLLMLIFCLPAITLVFFDFYIRQALGVSLPFAANIGIGYPGISQAHLLAEIQFFSWTIRFWALMIPCIMIASIGLAGGFHIIKMLAWGEGVAVVQTFFRGIKNNILTYMLMALIVGISVFIIALNISLSNYSLVATRGWFMSLVLVFSIIGLVFWLFMTMYMTTQAVTYKLKLFALVKNSIIFSIVMLFKNILFMALSLSPVLVMLIFNGIAPVVAMFYLMIGLSVTILIWTLYTHHVYDKFLNGKIEGAIKDRGVYNKKVERDVKEQEAVKRYSNPKKRKKVVSSIDDGKTFTPLGATFSRSDIARMNDEKDEVRREIEQELGADEAADDGEVVEAGFDNGVSGDFDTSDLEAMEGLTEEDLAALAEYEE